MSQQRDYSSLTLSHAQRTQPWKVPYSELFLSAQECFTPHIMGTHAVLHAQKTVGQLAAVFEALDHSGADLSSEQFGVLIGRSADLVTAAMRLANLYDFDLAKALVQRSEEKNNVILRWPLDLTIDPV